MLAPKDSKEQIAKEVVDRFFRYAGRQRTLFTVKFWKAKTATTVFRFTRSTTGLFEVEFGTMNEITGKVRSIRYGNDCLIGCLDKMAVTLVVS